MDADVRTDFVNIRQMEENVMMECAASTLDRKTYIEIYETFADLATSYDEIEYCGSMLARIRGGY